MKEPLQLGDGGLLAERVESGLRNAVAAGVLRAGETHSAYEIAHRLGVSRSPVREALLRLSESNIVRISRNRGFTVVEPDAREIREIFELRLMLEVPAAERATTAASPALSRSLAAALTEMRALARSGDESSFMKRDKEFHALLLRAAGNRKVVAVVGDLRDQTSAIGASTAARSRSLKDIAAAHTPILKAVRSGDGPAAARAMATHLTTTMNLLLTNSG